MGELDETVNEAVERAHEEHEGGHGHGAKEGGYSLNAIVAISVAITATFSALCHVKDENISEKMQHVQSKSVDAWAYYQAKGTKLNLAESSLDALKVEREITPGLSPEARALLDRKIGDYQQKMAHYEQEKADIKKSADGYKQEYDRLNLHDDQFDMAEATISVAIALLGITALTQKRRLLYVAWTFAGLGVLFGVAGFAGLPIHPDFLARFLG